MSSSRRSKRSDRHFHYGDQRDLYEDAVNGSNIYPRSYAPWQWGYWSADNMAYSGNESAYYVQDDRALGRPAHFAGNLYDNAGFRGHKHGYGGGSYKLKTASNEGFSEYPGEGHKRSSRRCIVVLSIVGLVFLIGAGLAIGIYFGVVDKPESIPPDPTTPAPSPEFSAQVTFTLDQPFNPDLNDPSSDAYKALETQVLNEIDENMRAGPQASAYSSVQLNGFSEGSVIAHAVFFFTRTSYSKNNVVVEITAENVVSELKEKLQQSQTTLILVDTFQTQISQATGKLALGDICSSPLDCAVANTVCTGSTTSVCQCDSSHFDNNGAKQKGVCLALKNFGETCIDETNCATTSSVCSGSRLVCSCADGKYYNQNTDSCDTKLQQGDPGCVDAVLQCQVTEAVCVNQRCACETGYQLKDNTCVKLLDYGESGCVVSTDCVTPEAVCAVRVCRCVSGDFYDTTTRSCKSKVEYDAPCEGNIADECKTTDAVCDTTTKKCKCSDNKYLNGDKCSDKTGDGESCEEDPGCSYTNAVCRSKLCTCDSDRFVNNDAKSCDLKVEYNAECKGTPEDECKTTNAVCDTTSKTCKCSDSQYLDEDRCLEKVEYDATCQGNSEDECKTLDAVCHSTSRKCKCTDSQYLNGDMCSDKVAYNAPCKGNSEEECQTTDAVCDATTTTCKCLDSQYLDGDKCSEKVKYNSACKGNFENECETTDAVCDATSKTCKCSDSKFLNGDKCSDKTGNGESCNIDAGCTYTNAVCRSELCTCDADRFVNNDAKSCDLKVEYDGTCQGNSENECKTTDAVCDSTSKKCKCTDRQYRDGDMCSDKVAYDVTCKGTSEEECETTDATCDATTTTCKCPDSQYLDGDKCSNKIEYGGTCKGNSANECETTDAVCDTPSKTCKCSDSKFLNGDKCSDKVEYDGACAGNVADECKTTDAECHTTTKTCKCVDSQYPEGDVCTDKVEYDATCKGNSGDECKTPNAVCDTTSKKCMCTDKQYLDGEMCSDKVEYNGTCKGNSANECETIDAVCTTTSKTCKCSDSQYQNGVMCSNKLDHKAEGCTDAELQCKTKDAVCVSNACDCDTNFYYAEEQCLPKLDNGVVCKAVEQCKIGGAVCDVTCQCETGKYNDGSMCQLKVAYGEVCNQDAMCKTSGGKCILDKCGCRENYVHDTEKDGCVIKKRYNEVCSFDTECITENATCITSLCLCSSDKYLDEVRCAKKKAIGEPCDSNEECAVEGSSCNDVCTCADDEYLDISCKPKVALGGYCSSAIQCFATDGECSGDMCKCPDQTYAADTSCLAVKSYDAPCTENEECATGICDKNQCGCLATQFYDAAAKLCKTKVAYNGDCTGAEQCDTSNAVCSPDSKCLCSDSTFLNDNVCLPKLGDGENCTTADGCSFKDAECTANLCTCGEGRFVNTITSSCDLKKSNGESCLASLECEADGAVCSETCQCPQDKYLDGLSCQLKKQNQVSCKTGVECAILGSDCFNETCQCPATKFQNDQAECIDRLNVGSSCTADRDCMDAYLCIDLVCACPDGFTFDGSSCMIVTTTTVLPTTIAPDVEVVIETESELKSNEPYDIALADNTSQAYQEKKAETEAALADEFANRTDIVGYTVTGFEPGSISIKFTITFRKAEVYAEAQIEADTTEELMEADNLVTKFINNVFEQVMGNVAKNLEEKGVFQDVSVPDKPAVIKKHPCENEIGFANRAETGICVRVLTYLQAVNSRYERCSAYMDILHCVAVRYKFDGLECEWNVWRTNVETFGLTAVGLNKTEVKSCVSGNRFDFKPDVFESNPCKDLTTLKMAARYHCSEEYKSVTRSNQDKCSAILEVEVCIQTILDQQFGDECTEKLSPNESLTLMIDHEADIFLKKNVALETCDLCLPPNVFHIWRKKCGLTMPLMSTAKPEDACNFLHMEMKCIETHLKTWSHSCTMSDLKGMFKSDVRFLNYGRQHLEWLDATSWNECLDNPLRIGPEEPESVCEDQVFISYFLFTGCIKEVSESCVPYYAATECVRKRIEMSTGKECLYKDIEHSIMATSLDYITISNILGDGALNPCILPETEDACESSIGFLKLVKGEDIINTCLHPVNNILYLPNLDELKSFDGKYPFSCSIYGQAEYCVMGMLASELELCAEDLFMKHIDILIQGLLQSLIEYSVGTGVPAPVFGVETYNGCSELVASSPSMDCLANSTVINAVTASCAVYVMGEQALADKCMTLETCVEGVKDWHRQHEVCPGFVDRVEAGAMNEDFAYFFWNISRLNWMTCSEETENFAVVLWFPEDPYNPEYADINSEAAQAYIASKWKMLDFLSVGRPFEVIAIYLEERVKRQTEPSPNGGTRLETSYRGPLGFEKVLMTQNAKLGEKVLIEDVRREGEREGFCPVVEAYQDFCDGYWDQCRSDDDCTIEGQKCCNDGSAKFCVNPTDAAEFSVTFRLDEIWSDLYKDILSEATQKLLKRYRDTMSSILSETESFSVIKLVSRRGDLLDIEYKVKSVYNPERMLREKLEEYNGIIRLGDVYYTSAGIEGRERCTDDMLISDNFLTCMAGRFADAFFHFQDFEVCSTISQLIDCAEEKCRDGGLTCDQDSLKQRLMNERSAIMQRIGSPSMDRSFVRIVEMLNSYDESQCQGQGDINPCYDQSSIEDAMDTCYGHLSKLSTAEPFTTEFCRSLHEFSSCVLVEIRNQGTRFCESYQIQERLLDFLSEEGSLKISAEEFRNKCAGDKKPVCTFDGLSEIYWQTCKPIKYFSQGSCSNDTVKEGVSDFISCARLQALRKEEDCEVDKIVGIINKDRYKLDFVTQNEDINDCISEETRNSIEEELKDRESVCYSSRALRHYHRGCSSKHCPFKFAEIEDDTARCTLLFQQVSCIQRNMKNESFECMFDTLLSSVPETKEGTSTSQLYIKQNLRDSCKEQLSRPGMQTCELPLLSRTNGSLECVQHLHHDLSHLDQDEKCKLVSLGAGCLTAVTTEVDAMCEADEILTALKHIALASDVGLKQAAECRNEVTTPAKTYAECDAASPTFDLCDESEVSTLLNLVELECNEEYNREQWNMTRLRDDFGIDESLLTCRAFNTFANCGQAALDRLKNICPKGYLRRTIAVNSESLTNSLSIKQIGRCLNVTYIVVLTLKNKPFIAEYNMLENALTMQLLNEVTPKLQQLFMEKLNWAFKVHGLSSSTRRKRQTSDGETLITVEVLTDTEDNPGELIKEQLEEDPDLGFRSATLRDPCAARISNQLQKCLLSDLQHHLDGERTCGVFNILWHCVKSGLQPGENCEDDLIKDQIFLDTYSPYYYQDDWMKCDVSAEKPDICNDVHSVNTLSEDRCWESFYSLDGSCDDAVKEKAVKCVADVIRLFGDCDDDTIRNVAIATLIYRSRQYYIPAVEECFDGFKRDGFCPLQSVYSMCRTCAGDYVDTCVTDILCQEGTKCCYDGCKRTCLPFATQPIAMETIVLLEKETWTDEYYSMENEITQELTSRYQPYLNGLMTYLEDDIATVQPEIIALWGSFDGVSLMFGFDSYVDQDRIGRMTQQYFTTNSDGRISYQYGNTKVKEIAERKGTCPRFSLDIPENQYGCCNDSDCNRDLKCCQISHKKVCIEPVREELAKCDDQVGLLTAAGQCGITNILSLPTELATYSCGQLFEKLNCMLGHINEDRPQFTECTLGGLRDTLKDLVSSEDLKGLFECKVWELLLKVHIEDCNVDDPAFVAYESKKDAVLASLGVMGKQEFCRSNLFRTRGHFYSNLTQYDLENSIYHEFKSEKDTRKKRQVSEDLIPKISVREVNLNERDWCSDTEVAKRFSLTCAKEKISSHYEDFQRCSPAFDFFNCVQNEYMSHIDDEACEMSDTLFRDVVLPYLRKELPANFSVYLEKLASYDPRSCGKPDENPCYDDGKQVQAYSECSQKYSIPTFSYISPEFCKAFYKLSSCMTVNLRSYGSRCDFYNAEEYVYKEVKRTVDFLPDYHYLLNCTAHRPACSAAFIKYSQHGICSRHINMSDTGGKDMNMSKEENNCSNDREKMTFKKLVSCVAINALLMGETDCTLSDIIDIIDEDVYKLSIVNKSVQISACITEEEISTLSAELTLGPGLCTSGVLIEHLAKGCFYTHANCRNGTLKDIPPEPSCSYLTPVLTCVQHHISESVKQTCSLSDLINTELPKDSMLTPSDESRDKCLAEVNTVNCVRDTLSTKLKEALGCAKATYRDSRDMYDMTVPSQPCSLYKYTLACLKKLLPMSCDATVLEINEGYIDILEYVAVDRNLTQCITYTEPDPFPDCEVPTTLPEGGNSCTDRQFVSDAVINDCAMQFLDKAEMYRDNKAATCLVYSRLLGCGINATAKFLTNQEANEASCTRDDINSALQEHAEEVKAALYIDPTQCQGDCYLRMDEVVNKCVRAAIRFEDYTLWQGSCRFYRYVYQCTHKALPDCEDKDVKMMALNQTLTEYGRHNFTHCKDPRNQLPLDICNNATDLMEISFGNCSKFVESLTRTPAELQQKGNCNNQTALRACMVFVLNHFTTDTGSDTDENMPCGTKTDDLIFRASLMGARMGMMFDVQEMEIKSTIIKACFGGDDRAGSCPYIEYRRDEGVSTCALNNDCEDTTQSCCYDGSSYNCRMPYTRRERYLSKLRLKNVPWNSIFYDIMAKETQEALGEDLEWINSTCYEQGWWCDISGLEENVPKREKRALNETGVQKDTAINFEIFAPTNPQPVFNRKIKEDGKNYEIVYMFFFPEEGPGMCPTEIYECHNGFYEWECEKDYNCRIQYGPGYKCCHHCGSRCVLVGDPETCEPVFNQLWAECSAAIDMDEFRSVLSYEPWTADQCSTLERITDCISEKNGGEKCGDTFFSEQIFRRIIEELGSNPYYFGYPKECGEVKKGHCPVPKDGDYGACYEMCSKDTDCEDEEKCCNSPCGYMHCMKPLDEKPSEKEMYIVILTLLEETFREGYRNRSSQVAKDLINRITPTLDELFRENLGWPYKIISFGRQERTKRQIQDLNSGNATLLKVETEAEEMPDEWIKDAIRNSPHLTEKLGFQKSYVLDIQDCKDLEVIYNRVKDTCHKDIHRIFSEEDTTEEKCHMYREFKACIKLEMSHCSADSSDNLDVNIDWNTWTYFSFLKRDDIIESDSFSLETEKCSSDNMCWSEEKILDFAARYCEDEITRLSGRGQMTKLVCIDVWQLVKCVTDSLNVEKDYWMPCHREDIERKLIPNIPTITDYKLDNQNFPFLELDFSSFDAYYCTELVCYPSGLKRLAKEDCSNAWNAYDTDDNCIHFTMFVGCARLTAMGNGEDCTIQDIAYYTEDAGNNLWPKSEDVNRTLLMCPVNCFDSWDVTDDIHVKWSVSSEDKGNAEFVIYLPSEELVGRYFALGISDTPSMINADIVTFEVPESGQPNLKNRFAPQKDVPDVDPKDHGYSVSFTNDETRNYIYFERPRHANDPQRDKALNGSRHLLMSMGYFDTYGQIAYHGSNRWASPSKFNFECSSNSMEDEVPNSPEEICSYWGVNHYHLRYFCLDSLDVSYLSNEEKCLLKEFSIGCVNERMNNDFGCTLEQTREAFDDPRTIKDFFDKNPDCTSVMDSLNHCDRHILLTGKAITDKCLMSAITFTQLEVFGISTDGIMAPQTTSSGPEELLKCSLLEEAVGCFMHMKPYTGMEGECYPTSYQNMLNVYMRIAQKLVVRQLEGTVDADDFIPLDFADCSLDAEIVTDYAVCPANHVIAEHISARCLPTVLIAAIIYLKDIDSLCPMESAFTECYTNGENERLQHCDTEDKTAAIEQYDAYIHNISGGFSPKNCKGFSPCMEYLPTLTDCIRTYSSLYLLAEKMNFTQKCTLLSHYQREARACLQEKAPECDEHIDIFMNGMNQIPEFQEKFPDRDQCEEDDIDMCQALQQFGVMECGWYMLVIDSDPNFTCLMRNCFENLDLPEKCGPIDRQALADKAIFETYFYPLGKCDGCKYGDKFIPNDESFTADDGCNTCSCFDGKIACTEKACIKKTFKVDIVLQDEPFNEDYREISNTATVDLINRIRYWLDMLFGELEYDILGFSSQNNRQKRQATGEPADYDLTVVTVKMDSVLPPDRWFQWAIEMNEDLHSKFMLETWSLIELSPCTPDYFDTAVKDTCAPSWNKLEETKECQHYVQFVTCVWYQDLVQDGDCSLKDVHNAMKNKTSQNSLPNEFCQDGLTEDYVESVLPSGKEEICENWFVNRHILEYYCMDMYRNSEFEQQDECLKEFLAIICVNEIVAEAGCTITQTSAAFKNLQLREDILDTSTDCDTSNPTARYLMLDARPGIMENCLGPVTDLLFINNLEDLMGYTDNQTQLKCIAYEDALGCVSMLTQNTEESFDMPPFNLDEVHKAVLYLIHMKANSEKEEGRYPVNNAQTYVNCTDDMVWPPGAHDECPNEEKLITVISVACARHVIDAMEYGCWSLQRCFEGIYNWYEDRELCMTDIPNIGERLKSAMNNTDFADFFKNITSLNWLDCPKDSECSEVNCSNVDCGSIEKHCCPSCTEDKPGFCPPVDGDQFGTCEIECWADLDCNGTEKCCNKPCGRAHCVEPLAEDPYKEVCDEIFQSAESIEESLGMIIDSDQDKCGLLMETVNVTASGQFENKDVMMCLLRKIGESKPEVARELRNCESGHTD